MKLTTDNCLKPEKIEKIKKGNYAIPKNKTPIFSMVYTSFVQVIKTKDGKIIKRSYTKLICFKKNMKQEEICVRNLPENIFYTIREKKLK
jgi:hypothetical protein